MKEGECKMKKYEVPEMEIMVFDTVSTITDSMLENVGGESDEDSGDF